MIYCYLIGTASHVQDFLACAAVCRYLSVVSQYLFYPTTTSLNQKVANREPPQSPDLRRGRGLGWTASRHVVVSKGRRGPGVAGVCRVDGWSEGSIPLSSGESCSESYIIAAAAGAGCCFAGWLSSVSVSGASKGGMKVGGAIPKYESLYKGSLILPTFVTPFEASNSVHVAMQEPAQDSQ